MRKILTSLSIIGFVAIMAISATVAYFNDTETSTGNTFSAGKVDLKIDLQCPGAKCGWDVPRDLHNDTFFHNPFDCDIKPGDKGEVTISWHIDDNESWGRIRLANIYDYERNCVEPEINDPVYPDTSCGDSPTDGELRNYLTFTIWMDEGDVEGWQCPGNKPCDDDLKEGNNKFDGSEEVKVADNMVATDLLNGVILPEILSPDDTYYIGFEWELPSSTPNIVQTDQLMTSIVMEVVQSRNNLDPWTP